MKVRHIEWENLRKGRELASRRLPHILAIPVIGSAREMLLRLIKKGDRLLDVGANDRNLEGFLAGRGVTVSYSSCDTDHSHHHDYYDLESVSQTFDIVTAFEVIEHMEPAHVAECFARVKRLIKEGGHFIISTPNVCNPVVFWRDCSHVTPFRYDELYGLLHGAGFSDIRIYRCGSRRLRDRLLALYYRPLLRLMRMDFATGIVAVAKNSPEKR